jgi:hypothetical protein
MSDFLVHSQDGKDGSVVVVVVGGASHSGHAAQANHSHLRAFQGLFLCFFE